MPATFKAGLTDPVLSKVTVSPLLKIVATSLVCQLEAPLTSQTFAVPSPTQVSERGVRTMLTSGVALASGELGLRPLAFVDATT